MALEFLYRNQKDPARVAVFPGAWNPPTAAHVAMAHAAAEQADEVLWVMPRAFPHKQFEGADFDARCRMLEVIARQERFSAAVADGGLYAEIAAEARQYYGEATDIVLVCGRDAAERIATWDYGKPGVFEAMLARHPLWVAARQGEYEPAGEHSARIVRLPMDSAWNDVSSSEVRRRIASGEGWESLVPSVLVPMISMLYGAGPDFK